MFDSLITVSPRPSSALTLKTILEQEVWLKTIRQRIFGTSLDYAAWEIIIAICLAQLQSKVFSIKELSLSAGLSATTGLRYLAHLQNINIVSRLPDLRDRRRVHLRLTELGQCNMNLYFTAVQASAKLLTPCADIRYVELPTNARYSP